MLLKVFQRAIELLRENRRFALLHLVRVKGSSPGKHGFLLLLTPGGERVGTIGGGDAERQMIAQAHAALAEGKSRSVSFELTRKPGNLVQSLCGGVNEVFIEVFMEKPFLLLLGGGHVAQALAKLCEHLEYPYVVIDDRPEYSRKESFPGAMACEQSRPAPYLQSGKLPAFSHVIGLGYNAEFDLEGIVAGLKTLAAGVRFGAIASKAKHVRMSEIALERGITPEQWQRVKCPVGINIGAQTPAEIAVSIMAEVIASIEGRESTGWH